MHVTIQMTELGNPHAPPTRLGRSIVRKTQCAGGEDARKSEGCCVMQQIEIQDLSRSKES